MKRQTFLTSEHLDLVLLHPEDAAQLASWFNNPAVTKYLARGDYPMTEPAEVAYLEKLYQDTTKLQLGVWHRADKQLIGTVGMHNIHDRDRRASFGIALGEPDYWNAGYGSEILATMLSWAFATRGLRLVTLSVLGNNPRAIRCYEKCGFVPVGTYPQSIYKEGQWQDEHLMMCQSPLLS